MGRSELDLPRRILEKLEEWQQKEGPLPAYLGLYEQLLRIQAGAEELICRPPVEISPQKAKEKIWKGIPLLEWDTLSIDWKTLRDLYNAAATVLLHHVGSDSKALLEIGSDIELLKEAARAWYGDTYRAWADAHGVEAELLAAAVHCAAKPFIIAHASTLLELVPQDQWRRGFCPICGGKPDFAYIEKEPASRWLLCSRCDSTWLFQRIECPYCENKDQAKLGYRADERNLYRLYLCEQCKSYL
ncbi:MAG: formate dehydrogenase accessory protein FdhE, partial [Dehalococcoidia bacterium]|nr:formate dehydrogenase accessory protein FdhE [Dehalococcoidia bacterium]